VIRPRSETITTLSSEFLAEGVAHGLACESAGGGELGPRFEDAGRDHGECEGSFARGSSVEESFDAEASGRAEHGDDMAVRSRAQDREGGVERRQGDSSLEQGSESFDELVGPRLRGPERRHRPLRHPDGSHRRRPLHCRELARLLSAEPRVATGGRGPLYNASPRPARVVRALQARPCRERHSS